MKLYEEKTGRYANELNTNLRNQALIANVVRRLVNSGGQVIRDTGNGSVYVGLPDTRIVRVSDHDIMSRGGFVCPKGDADRDINVSDYQL